ncbi:MAG: coniferyl aldehyde dehydrogenase [Zhongshania sp.]|uniref:coniferyl aldehyde dehydrogenase n=1 Tax=Zhongshania sp. TaxID=1971902 RepID=UPI0026385B0C|nr:coniferyl aldehyde dehydrogenase [Zhongshania sp.]MDF1691453.1 coniferyl aldehyde dehydrogenase [Zhongshania sp.]
MNQPHQDSAKPLQELLQAQRDSFMKDGFPDAAIRIDRLARIADIHLRYKDQLIEALSHDFGHRSRFQSTITDVLASSREAKETQKEVKKWMRPENRKVPFPMNIMSSKAQIHYQPLGVIGNMSPWNFPAHLAFSPAIGAIAAGNRVMLKPSDLTPATSTVISTMVADGFDPTEMTVVNGDVNTAIEFSKLAFDHLVYTGGPEIAKSVMAAAAQNLVPLTLELGGKCPVIVDQSANIQQAAQRTMTMKIMNSGQLCLSPDYVLLPETKLEEFLSAATATLGGFFSSIADNEDVTSIINQRHYDRLQGYIDEAKAAGCRIEEFNPANEDFSNSPRKMPFRFVINPDESLRVINDELFGPILVIKTYRDFNETVSYVNSKHRPLALYCFSNNKTNIQNLLQNTCSGGVTINDVAQHITCPDLPLAGIGNSGMGSYHGHHGFLQFSHKKAVYHQGLLSIGKYLAPPSTDKKQRFVDKML